MIAMFSKFGTDGFFGFQMSKSLNLSRSHDCSNPGLMDVLGEKFGFQVSRWLNLSQSHDTKDGVQSWAYGQDWQRGPMEGFGSFWTIGHPKFQYHIKSKMVSNFLGLWAGLALVALGEHWPPLPIPRAGKASSGQQRGKEF